MAEAISRRPQWLPGDRDWIDATTARRLAALPTTTPDVVRWALRLTYTKRRSLEGLAGFFRKRLEAPDLEGVAEFVREHGTYAHHQQATEDVQC